jgi:hypothetical protein
LGGAGGVGRAHVDGFADRQAGILGGWHQLMVYGFIRMLSESLQAATTERPDIFFDETLQ